MNETFEILPNEILIECFRYLKAVQIFYAFNQLNHRFNTLIRSISLHLDFQNLSRLISNYFCQQILSDLKIKKQIVSLHLSNIDTTYGIQLFLSNFSLDEFPYLQSLTITDLKTNNVTQLISTIPLLSNLTCFRLISCQDQNNDIRSIISTSQLKTLLIQEIPQSWSLMSNLSSIINLTISEYKWREVCQILTNATKLKYLRIEHLWNHPFYYGYSTRNLPLTDHHAIYLQQLIMININYDFHDIKMILERTPNLRNLTIINRDKENLINAEQWEELITFSLPNLKIFKFKFSCFYQQVIHIMEEKLKAFQSNFWYKEHHWYTEYSLSSNSASIYTIPYISNIYELKTYSQRFSNELTNNVNKFENVKNLIIYLGEVKQVYQYNFPHAESLSFGCRNSTEKLLITLKDIEWIKMVINLSNIKHLIIPFNGELQTSSVLLEILKETPQLSSLAMHPNTFKSLLEDDELCKYFNKMIQKLDITYSFSYSLDNFMILEKFCEVFANLEQLSCTIHRRDSILFLLRHLSKLAYVRFTSEPYNNNIIHDMPWLEEQTNKLGIRIFYDFVSNYTDEVTIWIV